MYSKSIIVAYNKHRVIGDNNSIPWYDKEDLKRFKALTTGRPIIMGRKTHESIGKILPNRPNIILTRNDAFMPKGLPAYVAPNLETAFTIAEGECFQLEAEQMFIIGGEEIYRQALPFCDTLYISEINNDLEGDAKFPEVDLDEWDLHLIDEVETHTFKMYKRRT